jgi:hypothetical protein
MLLHSLLILLDFSFFPFALPRRHKLDRPFLPQLDSGNPPHCCFDFYIADEGTSVGGRAATTERDAFAMVVLVDLAEIFCVELVDCLTGDGGGEGALCGDVEGQRSVEEGEERRKTNGGDREDSPSDSKADEAAVSASGGCAERLARSRSVLVVMVVNALSGGSRGVGWSVERFVGARFDGDGPPRWMMRLRGRRGVDSTRTLAGRGC